MTGARVRTAIARVDRVSPWQALNRRLWIQARRACGSTAGSRSIIRGWVSAICRSFCGRGKFVSTAQGPRQIRVFRPDRLFVFHLLASMKRPSARSRRAQSAVSRTATCFRRCFFMKTRKCMFSTSLQVSPCRAVQAYRVMLMECWRHGATRRAKNRVLCIVSTVTHRACLSLLVRGAQRRR